MKLSVYFSVCCYHAKRHEQQNSWITTLDFFFYGSTWTHHQTPPTSGRKPLSPTEKHPRGEIRSFVPPLLSAVIIGASPGTQSEPCPEGGDRPRGRCCCLPGRRTAGGGMERPLLPLLLSELRVGNAACDVSLSRSRLGWNRRPSGPVYRPFRPSKTRMCVSGLCARVVSVGPFETTWRAVR